jgi:hypothetical protein
VLEVSKWVMRAHVRHCHGLGYFGILFAISWPRIFWDTFWQYHGLGYFGKVVASPESGLWWVKWVRVARGLSQHQECFQRWTNQLVVGFVVGCEWVNKLVPLLSPIPEPQHAPLPLLVLSAKSVPLSPQTSAFLKLRPPWA